MSGIRGWSVATTVWAIIALQALAGPVSAASNTWMLTCKFGEDSTGFATASATWEWLQDGVVIGTGAATSCDTSGGGDRPETANGITATLTAMATAFLVGSDSTTKKVTVFFDSGG